MARRIEKVGVIGSGIMGGGIAALCASAGIPTLLLDIVPFDLKDEEKNDPEARNRIVSAGLQNTVKAKPPAFMDKKNDMLRLETGNLEDDFDKLKDCDLIVEVIVENLKIKQDLFSRIEKVRHKDAIISSNTSGLPLEKMAEGRSKEFKEHFLITHFFNPVRYMKLLELVPGKDNKPEVLEFIEDFGERILGKGIVWAKDTPNFIGNRIGVQFISEAFQLLQEKKDVSIPEIDNMFGATFGIPRTAVFGLADLVGLDTIGHLADNSYELLTDDERRDVYKLPDFVRKMIENNLHGNKTKAGFYKKEIDPKTWKPIRYVIDLSGEYKEFDRKALVPECAQKAKKQESLADKQKAILFGSDKPSEFAWQLISRSLIYAANRIPEISDNIVGIDNAMKWGYAWEAGPFEIWDNIGVKESVERMKKDGLEIPKPVQTLLDKGFDSFYRVHNGKKQYFDFASGDYNDIILSSNMIFLETLKEAGKEVKGNSSASLIDMGDGVFNLEFHTKMNALNDEILEFFDVAREYVQENGVGLVIGNQAPGVPGAFSAGADLGMMGELAKNKQWSKLEEAVAALQGGLQKLRYSFFPVVAAPFGMALGGGCETCLWADKRVAHADLFIGLVEIGAGLLPAGGGTTHIWKNMVQSMPEGVTLEDLGPLFIPTFKNVAMASVTSSAHDAFKKGFLMSYDRIVFNKDYLIGEAKKEVLRMVDDGYAPPLKKPIKVMGDAAQGMIDAELFNMSSGGYITPHMKFIARKIAYVMSGGEARAGSEVSEDYMLQLERDAFVELWQTENSQKMAEHIKNTGKPLMI